MTKEQRQKVKENEKGSPPQGRTLAGKFVPKKRIGWQRYSMKNWGRFCLCRNLNKIGDLQESKVIFDLVGRFGR